MGCPRIQMWTWTLCVFLSWMCAVQALGGPQYMVTIPAVLEAGSETKFCTSLLQPNETLVITVTLISDDDSTTLLKHTSSEEFNACTQFKVPLVHKDVVQKFEVEVRGDTFYSKEVRKVMIKVYQPMTFVQTDKPIYLPGQTVHFRVVTLDTKFRPASRLYDIIELKDVDGNRIGQWLNEMSNSKILQLSHTLNSEAREGNYEIIVSFGDKKVYQNFKVEKYVLPKFEVKLDAADEVSIAQEEIKAEVCAKYTYGQSVPGKVNIEVCRPLLHYFHINRIINPGHPEGIPEVTAPCVKDTKQTDKQGCATFTFKISAFTKVDQKVLEDALHAKANVEEEGTGISHPQEKRISISYVAGRLSFIDTPKIYNQGSNVEGKVKAVYYNNTPIPELPVYLFEGGRWSSRHLQNLTTDSEGVATFSFNTTNYSGDIHLHASDTPTLENHGYRTAHHVDGDHRLSRAQEASQDTKTVSSLEVKKKDKPLACDTEEDIFIQYTVVGEAQGNVDVMYLVLSRGAIVMQGLEKVEVHSRSVNEGEVSLKLKVSPEMAPEVQVVAYAVLPSETVIATSSDFSTEKCFSHKVSLEFSPSSAVPGEETTMQVTAEPDSLCGVSAVDQSVLIKEPGKGLNADKIFDLLPVKKTSYIPYEVEDPTECLTLRSRRDIMPQRGHNEKDVYTIFKNVGLKMATNLFIQMPSCLNFRGRQYYYNRYGYRYKAVPDAARMNLGLGMAAPPGPPVAVALEDSEYVGAAPIPQPITTVRTFFPETWIWDLVEVGESGTKDVSLTVPDTITTWETEAFCLSSQGFGLAPRKEIKVFQPFFLELTLPYSIIRGEHFELKATTFNYLTSCIMVSVTPAPSSDYNLTPLSGDKYTSCLCGNERKTLSWTMAPSALGKVNVSVTAEAVASHASCDNEIVSVPDRGRIDKVTKSLIVKAEGIEMTKAYNWLLCPKGEAVTEEIDTQLPENVIDGSARASVSVLGDILGRALQNLDGLLQMPYGCGEQNMALLAPNIYILQYLKNTQQLTPAISEKARNFLTSGYQRQLNYKDYGGAYSTFGSGPGNTWLTAFVLRTFAKARSFIYIDPYNIEHSKTWLENSQQEDGCFEQSGKLFNNRMKGGVSDKVTLSAYITTAFLEMNMPADSPVITKSLSCLKESISDLSNTYTTALLAYVFTLAGDMETRAHLLQHLDTVALQQGGFLHWSQTAAETSASLSVEISSYVLLAKLSASPTAEDLGYSSRIVRWLTTQQNYYGGFSSTQDTVVALQALALYSTLVFSPQGSSTVTVQSPSGQLTFDVNQNNKLLYQEKTLQDTTGKYSLEVKGTACASVQVSLHYNIPTPADVSTFSVEVKPEADCNSESPRPKVTLNLKSQYNGKLNSTNMVILDIKVLSGFVPDPESLKRFKSSSSVNRVEQDEDHVLVYIQELLKDIPINHQLELVQEIPVQNLKPAVVKIYDYYQPSDQAETEYIYPCAAAQ
uniref:Alpha-2-macroglobulin-like n=1 Tax=Anabas testudineus TaxID=64144 RepID=A0A3Q1K3Z3_ANATE